MKNRNLIIGIFVVSGVILFTLVIFLIGNQNKTFARHVEFYTEFANVNGIVKGAKVRVSGFDAGEVTDIRVPDSPSSKFRLTIKLVEQVHRLVRADSVVTIATEGVVGDKFLMIHSGTANAPEAALGSTLPSKDPVDMADLLEKGAGLLSNASATMNTVAAKLNGTLDAMSTTVNNANDVIVGIKDGRGTVGLLLRDEDTADNVRQTVANVRHASVSISHATSQADAMLTDLQSRSLGKKADQAMTDVQDAAQHLDATSQQLHRTIATALGPDTQGVDAGTNIRQATSNLNRAVGNMAEDTEALKHQFFFRGFFRKRGYYSLENLNPEQYRNNKIFTNQDNPRVWLEASTLFEERPDGSEVLTPLGKNRIDSAMAQLGDSAIGQTLVVEGYATSGSVGAKLALSRQRSILVRDYLHNRFKIDTQNLGAVSLRGAPPPSVGKQSWDGICLVILKTIHK